jgi:hypothetical protein
MGFESILIPSLAFLFLGFLGFYLAVWLIMWYSSRIQSETPLPRMNGFYWLGVWVCGSASGCFAWALVCQSDRIDGLFSFMIVFIVAGFSTITCIVRFLMRLREQHTLDSLIVGDMATIFEEFGKKQFRLLWRGSRDGFGAAQFHKRCDGHANTLTLIMDTEKNVFGGFTPVKWESDRSGGDESQKSFLFTLKNPRNVTARKLALRPERWRCAISYDMNAGPIFGNSGDIWVSDHCNSNTDSSTGQFGDTYMGDTELDNPESFFTGSDHFQVSEIEVFELTE